MRADVREQVDMFDDLFYRYLEYQGLHEVRAATFSTAQATFKHELQHLLNITKATKIALFPCKERNQPMKSFSASEYQAKHAKTHRKDGLSGREYTLAAYVVSGS